MHREKLKLGKKAKADIILTASLLLLAAVLYFVINADSSAGTTAVVRINGKTVAEYSLAVNGTYPLNGGTNTLIIENGTAHMEKADCPDKICVKQGIISKSGQCITCLPNKLTVTIEGGTPEVDAITGQ